jgi:hypothetical protein
MSKPKKLQIRNRTAEFFVFTTGIGSAAFSRQSRLARLARPQESHHLRDPQILRNTLQKIRPFHRTATYSEISVKETEISQKN